MSGTFRIAVYVETIDEAGRRTVINREFRDVPDKRAEIVACEMAAEAATRAIAVRRQREREAPR